MQNKRAVVIIDSPEFGPVAVVCIGATMVGSIVFTAEEGKTYSKVRLPPAADCISHSPSNSTFIVDVLRQHMDVIKLALCGVPGLARQL